LSQVIKLSSPATREFWEIPVLHEDDRLLVLDKPPGLPTSADRFNPDRPNLLKLLHRDIERGATWTKQRNVSYLANAHRLDEETSGVILLAKDKAALIYLADLFGSEKPTHVFSVLVKGTPPESEFEIDAKLAPDLLRVGRMRVDHREGKRSRTIVRVRERFRGYTLLECQPLTHRIHQIRIHLAYFKLPVVGDKLYSGSPLLLSTLKSGYRLKHNNVERPLLSMAAVHSEQISLSHPTTGVELLAKANWPKDFAVAMKFLRRYSLE
jgi:23S rRNA pseudouridine1911/1915/1917 synthase